jgi:hypothetical protein
MSRDDKMNIRLIVCSLVPLIFGWYNISHAVSRYRYGTVSGRKR